MNGDDVGELNVYIKTGTGLPSTPTRKIVGTYGNQWNMDSVTFSAPAQIAYQIVFEAVVGRGARGSISIDHVTMSDGECLQNFCDFESTSICGYTNDTTGDFFWERNKGPTGSTSTGYENL